MNKVYLLVFGLLLLAGCTQTSSEIDCSKCSCPTVNCTRDCPSQECPEIELRPETMTVYPVIARKANCYTLDGVQFTIAFNRFNFTECPNAFESGVLIGRLYDTAGALVGQLNWTINSSDITLEEIEGTCGGYYEYEFYMIYEDYPEVLDELWYLDLLFYGDNDRVYYTFDYFPEEESICLGLI